MKVHLFGDWEPEILEVMIGASQGTGEFSLGEETPSGTEVLVKGVVSAEELAALPDLKAVIVPWRGLPGGTAKALVANPGIKGYTVSHNAASTAEKGLAMLMGCAQRVVPFDQGMRKRDWGPRFGNSGTVKLAGHVMTVLGFGEIGKRTAAFGKGLDMTVRAVRRKGPFGLIDGVEVFPVSEMVEACRGTRALMGTLPLTPETKGLVGASVFEVLDPLGIVVNVGRGATFVEEDLFEACSSGQIFGAGLDVWWTYPSDDQEASQPGDCDWASLKNVVMSPHCGGDHIENEPERAAAVGDLVRRISLGGGAENQVDPAAGY